MAFVAKFGNSIQHKKLPQPFLAQFPKLLLNTNIDHEAGVKRQRQTALEAGGEQQSNRVLHLQGSIANLKE